MGPLDSMLSQYTQYRQGQSPVTNVPTTPSTPGRPGFDISGPQSFFAAAGPSGGGFGSGPGDISAGGFSKGSSPFGQGVPNLTPYELSKVVSGLSHLTYDLEAGGYRFRDAPYTGNLGAWHGSDPRANALAKSIYGIVGSAPTRPIGTTALNSLPGYSPTPGPSYNEKLGQSYFGPFTFPGYNPLG